LQIHYFIESTFNSRDYERLGIKFFIEKGLEVFIWDFTSYFHPNVVEKYTPHDYLELKNYIIIQNKNDFEVAWKNIYKTDFVFNVLSITINSLFVLKNLNYHKISYLILILGLLPSFKATIFERIVYKVKSLPKYYKKHSKREFEKYYKPQFAVVGGLIAEKKAEKIKGVKLIRAHSLDYDLFIKSSFVNNTSLKYPGKYAVFIDEFLPFHPDNLVRRRKPDVKAKDYYGDLNQFFKKVESQFGLTVVVAAHPRSNYHKTENPFRNFTCIHGDTVSLIKNSVFVMTHASTAISLAILYEKPLLFLASFKYSRILNKTINNFANLFNTQPVFVNKYQMKIKYPSISRMTYDKYKTNYIINKESDELLTFEIIYKSLVSEAKKRANAGSTT